MLLELCPAHAFDDSTRQVLFASLGVVVGRWLSEQQRVEGSPVKKGLLSTGRNLEEIGRILGGHETGFHSDVEIEIVSQLKGSLVLDPTIGSVERADQLITLFRHDAQKMAHACLVAGLDLGQQSGASGRARLDWHDDFTKLLLNIARAASIEPALGFDRINDTGCGWLFDASEALEGFLWPGMRAPSKEAAVKRLERSKRRLELRRGQNHPRD